MDALNQSWKDRLRYFRCHSIVDGRCTCGKKPACDSEGKHPKSTGWKDEALSSTPEQVAAWSGDAKINLGLLCGAESDVFVLDVERDGVETLLALTKQHGALPATFTVLTGGGGRHYYFKHPSSHVLKNKVKFQPYLDVRTTGGLVIAPGGRHKSGRSYECTIDCEPVHAPTWLLDLIVAGQKKDQQPKAEKQKTSEQFKQGERNSRLASFAGKLRRQGLSAEALQEALLVENRRICQPPLSDHEVRIIAQSIGRYEPADVLDDTDKFLSDAYAEERKEELRYLMDDRSWRNYESGLWLERDSGPIHDCSEYLKAQEPLGATKTLHRRLQSEKTVASVLRLAKDHPLLRARFADLDPNPWLLGLPNGLALDLKSGEVRGAQPSDLLTLALPIVPSEDEPANSCPRWLQYLDETHPGDSELQAYLQRYAGYCLTASSQEEQLTFFIGEQGAGKGTYTKTVEHALGPYFTMLPLDLLLEEAKEDRRLNHIAELRGKRLGVCNEGARSKKLDRNALKNLSGGDSVVGRRLGHQAFKFPMTAKLLIVSNDEPVLDLDDAMKARVHVVPFGVSFRGTARDQKDLKEYFKERELPGILRWMIDGCLHWQETGLKPPASIVSRTQEYFKNSDLFDQYLQECLEFGDSSNDYFFGPTMDLLEVAKKYCSDRGDKTAVTHERLFTAELRKRRKELLPGRPRGKGFSGQSGFFGVRLNEEGQRILRIIRPGTFSRDAGF